ncbi:MAG: hypothetical protein R3B69_02500 [Candidatus Paceibacterota bacterium]
MILYLKITLSHQLEQVPPAARTRASGLGRMRLRPSFGAPATGARASEPSTTRINRTSNPNYTSTTTGGKDRDRNWQPLARIQEINNQVNSRIGNPVNLIDADNAIGREYMNALLDAMKKPLVGNSPVLCWRL